MALSQQKEFQDPPPPTYSMLREQRLQHKSLAAINVLCVRVELFSSILDNVTEDAAFIGLLWGSDDSVAQRAEPRDNVFITSVGGRRP